MNARDMTTCHLYYTVSCKDTVTIPSEAVEYARSGKFILDLEEFISCKLHTEAKVLHYDITTVEEGVSQ